MEGQSTTSATHAIKSPRRHAGRVTVTGHGDQVVITLNTNRPEAWSYNMATGQLTSTTPEPPENVSPVGGIGVVIKKNPGGSAERAMPTSGGGADLSSLEEGGYDVSVRFPKTSSAAAPPRPTPRAKLWLCANFHVNVGPGGITHDPSVELTVTAMAINEKGTAGTKSTTKK